LLVLEMELLLGYQKTFYKRTQRGPIHHITSFSCIAARCSVRLKLKKRDVINLTSNPAETINHGNKTMVKFSDEIRKACDKNGIKTLERTLSLNVEEQFKLVREHFGL